MLHNPMRAGLALSIALLAGTSAIAQQRVLTFNTDTSDPAPKAAFEALIADFEAEYPEIDVQVNLFDHEGYKTAIRNFLTADSPDLANWYAGNRMKPFVDAGQFLDVSDVWTDNGLNAQLASAESSMTIDGKQWGVPYTYYQWGVYYNKSVYEQVGAEVPETYDQFVENCQLFKDAGIDCLTTGTSQMWPAAGLFDYFNLRTHGYDFHMQLTAGEIPWTDERVRETFAQWNRLVEPGYITENAAAIDWQDAAALLSQGEAANYVMGNFAVATFKDGGMTDDTLGFFPFPQINPDVERAEDAPTDTVHIPAGAKNPEDAKTFLAYLARPDVQTKLNTALGQLPVNNEATVDEADPFLSQGFTMLSEASGLAQFFDRDAPAEMAASGMEGFQEFMAYPGNLEDILNRLESDRQRIYAQ